MTGRTAAALEQRVDDLLDRMILAEKTGLSLQTMIMVGSADLAERNSTFGVESAEHISGNNFEYDLKPFRAAIAGGVAQIMPYYGMPGALSTTKSPSASTKESSPICCAESWG